jgi:hypothetical protein
MVSAAGSARAHRVQESKLRIKPHRLDGRAANISHHEYKKDRSAFMDYAVGVCCGLFDGTASLVRSFFCTQELSAPK